LAASDTPTLTVSTRRPPAGPTRSTARAVTSMASRAAWSIVSPAPVKRTVRLVRQNSRTPSRSSIAQTWTLTAPGVTPSSSAALVKLRWRAAASNVRSGPSPGNRLNMQAILELCSTMLLQLLVGKTLANR
jgi:hypothetical protein